MVQRVQVLLEDDLVGGQADETVHFAIDGKSYEIDLKESNAQKLRSALAPYVENARRQAGRAAGSRRTPVRGLMSGEEASRIRAWARANGFEVNDRGRVPANVREAFEKAN